MKTYFWALVIAAMGIALPGTVFAVPAASLTHRWTINNDDKGKPREVLAIGFTDEKGALINQRILYPDSRAVRDAKLYRVTNDGKALAVKIDDRAAKQGKLLAEVVLVPVGKFDSTKKTVVDIVNETDEVAFRFKGYQPIYATKGLQPKAEGFDYRFNQEYVKGNKAIEPKLELKAGDGGGAVSVKAVLGKNLWQDDGVFRWQTSLDADVAVNKTKRNAYLDSIIGEFDLLRVTPFGSADKFSGVSEFVVHARMESDREFETVNAAFGLGEWLVVQHPALAGLARALCVVGDYPDSPSPLILTLSYDYVVKVSEDAMTGQRLSDVGNNRLRARLYWDLLLAHGLNIPLLKQTRDLSFLIDVGAIYDLEHGKFSPDTRLTLELSPTNPKPDGKEFSFVLSYVNGKTTPTYQNYDEFLAGFKVPF